MVYNHLPKIVRQILAKNFLRNFGTNGYQLPHSVEISGSDTYSYYMDPIRNMTGFVFVMDLKNNSSNFIIGVRGGGYRESIVDSNKEIYSLPRDVIVVSGYLDFSKGYCLLVRKLQVKYHPKQIPNLLTPLLDLSDRERRILYVFGALKEGVERRMALINLHVEESEINSLIARGLLKRPKERKSFSNLDPIITLLAENNRLSEEEIINNQHLVDQW